ncbi:MAG: DNA-binding protein [Candidatus Riflebacteria bacterium]|nr:DNA-binding protein [Candidatus Riflebacteria bacterium]
MLDHLIGRGLQREPVLAGEPGRLLARAAIRLKDAGNDQISLESRFDLAYEALLQIGLAALRANGLRPDSRGGHHVLALQTLETTIGFPRQRLRLLDEFRRKRAAALDDGAFEPSAAELDALLRAAQELQAHFLTWLRREHPDLLP